MCLAMFLCLVLYSFGSILLCSLRIYDIRSFLLQHILQRCDYQCGNWCNWFSKLVSQCCISIPQWNISHHFLWAISNRLTCFFLRFFRSITQVVLSITSCLLFLLLVTLMSVGTSHCLYHIINPNNGKKGFTLFFEVPSQFLLILNNTDIASHEIPSPVSWHIHLLVLLLRCSYLFVIVTFLQAPSLSS